MRAFAYACEEALVSLRRSLQSAAMSIGTIAIAFLTLGGFWLLSTNLQVVVERWASAAEMSVYLRDDVDETTRQQLIADLSAHPAVAGVEFVGKDQAMTRFKNDFPELGDVLGDADNPLPPSLEVQLRTDAASEGAADVMAGQLAQRSGVADVRYDRQWLSRLLAILATIRMTGLAISAILVLGAAFTVGAVVRMSLEARKEELDIMQLVGAPFSFVRGPSIAEGALLGALGATLSLIALWALFRAVGGRINEVVAGVGSVGDLQFLSVQDALLLIVTGLAVGSLAGLLASRVAR